MKAKNTLAMIAGLLIIFSACKKEDKDIQPDASQDAAASFRLMESELKKIAVQVDSLSKTHDVVKKAHHDSLYHVHHNLFLHHHSQYTHTDVHATHHNDPHSIHHHTVDSLHAVHLKHVTH